MSYSSRINVACRWTNQRKVFGKPLHSQAVIRNKLAAMISRVESAQAWLENVTYQMNQMNYKDQAEHLAGYVTALLPGVFLSTEYLPVSFSPIALLKRYATSTAQETAKDAVQIFGGRGITRTGMGKFIEHYHRTVPFDA